MKVSIDSHSGFCFGVTSAIHKAQEELQRGSLFCLGDIVHNGQEVERLERLGLETIDYDDLRSLRGVRVLLRAHGEPPSTYQIAKENEIEIIDASCPVVLHLQKRIRDTYAQIQNENSTAQIVIFGKIGHAEVIGLQGQTNDTAIVVEGEEDLHKIDTDKEVYLFSQTTKSVAEFQKIAEDIRFRMAHPEQLHAFDTICRNVAGRGEHLRTFARENDVVIFVGGHKSSNAKVLFEICQKTNPHTYFVNDENEIDANLMTTCRQAERVGICGATSTPGWLMEQVKNKITQNNENDAKQ